jgi:hypothetical protein
MSLFRCFSLEGMLTSKMSSVTIDNVRPSDVYAQSWGINPTDEYRSAACADFSSSFQTKCPFVDASSIDSSLRKVSRPARDSSCSSRSSTQWQHRPCRYGSSCFNEDCWFSHPPGWHVCEDGVRCDDFDCTASHPRGR